MKRIIRSILAVILVAASMVPVLPAERAAASSGRILFVTANTNEIVTINPDGTDRQVLASGYEPVISPDGTKVAFSSGGNIHVVSTNGGTPVQITAIDQNASPYVTVNGAYSWSPDGTEVIYSELTYTLEGPYDYAHIIRAKADGSGRTNISAGLNDTLDSQPQWSPDGTQILFTSKDLTMPDSQLALMKMQPDGSNRQLIDANGSNGSWSPDGQYVSYFSRVGPSQIVTISNADGSNRKTVPGVGLYPVPTWSPVSNTFLAASDGGASVVRADGTIAATLSGVTSGTSAPKWTADGQTVIFDDTSAGQSRLFGRALVSGPRKLLYSDPQGVTYPQWYGPGGIVIDADGPTLAVQPFGNPIPAGQPFELVVGAQDFSPIVKGEYFIGPDPGQGNGNFMDYNGDAVSHFFVDGFTPGTHIINVRALDSFGNWSAVLPVEIIAESPQAPNPPGINGVTGNRTVRPRLSNGDVLPGLITNNQTDTATFNLNVQFAGQGTATPTSDFTFTYQTGRLCNIPRLARNCHSFSVDASVINSLTINGANNSLSTFEGTATVQVDGTTSTRTFRVQALDGTRQTPRVNDRLTLEVFAEGEGSSGTPQYKVSAPVQSGNISIN